MWTERPMLRNIRDFKERPNTIHWERCRTENAAIGEVLQAYQRQTILVFGKKWPLSTF